MHAKFKMERERKKDEYRWWKMKSEEWRERDRKMECGVAMVKKCVSFCMCVCAFVCSQIERSGILKRPKRKGHVKIYNKSSEIKSFWFSVIIRIHSFVYSFIHSYWLNCIYIYILLYFSLANNSFFSEFLQSHFSHFVLEHFAKKERRMNKKQQKIMEHIFSASHFTVMPCRRCYTTFALEILLLGDLAMPYTHTQLKILHTFIFISLCFFISFISFLRSFVR